MKKYLFGILATILAIGFSAFTTLKKTDLHYSADYYFRLTAFPTGSNLQATPSSGQYAGDYYLNWQLVESHSCPSAMGRACTVAVSENYMEEIAGEIRLLATDPDGWGPKLAFPMIVENGTNQDCVQYKIVSPYIETWDIDVTNTSIDY
jgi:hypothetical protein